MKTKIKKLMLTIVLVLSAVVLSPAQTNYEQTVYTGGEDISITQCVVNVRPYDNENLKKTRILAKNGTEFAITFPESYQNLSIVRNNTNIVIEGMKIRVKEPGLTSFKFSYTENGVSYTSDFAGDVNYYGELSYNGKSDLQANPIEVKATNENNKLVVPNAFPAKGWGFRKSNVQIPPRDLTELGVWEETVFSEDREISLKELLRVGAEKGQLRNNKLEIVLEFGDITANTLMNGIPGGTSFQIITLIDARTYNLSLSQVGQGTVSASKSQLKAGESATLSAQAAQGWRFDRWEENGQNLGTTNPFTVTIGAQDRSIKAVFTEIPKVVTLQILDTKGQKLADPQTQEVTSGGTVTFQVPNLANVNFKGWKRNGQIVETGNTYTLSNVTQNETIQAVFEVPVQSLSLSFTELNLKVGESKPLPNVTVIPSNATDETITWVSNDPGIAKIENGKVVGVSAGSVDLVASSSNQKKATLKVVVAELPRFIVTLQIVDTKGQKLAEPQQREVTSGGNVVFQTPNVPNANFKGWKRNSQIVETGGSYTLSNLTQNETIQAVFEVPVQSVTVIPASITAKVGEGPVQLTATVLPSNATSKTVTWTSKNEQVVKVDSTGKVTIIGVGETTIEAKAGEKIFAVQVKIESQQPQETDFPPYTANLQTFKVNQTVDASKVVWENFPQGLDKTAIKYSLRDFNGVDISNNKQIFEVNGQNLTFKKIGSYFLIVTLRDNQNNEIRIDLTIQVNE